MYDLRYSKSGFSDLQASKKTRETHERMGVPKAPVKTGGVLRMKEPHGEGVATHTGPESCGDTSNGVAEALTGVRTGQVWSHEIH